MCAGGQNDMRQLFIACGLFALIMVVSLSARADDAGGPCNVACDGPCQSCHGADLGWPGAVNGTCAHAPPGYPGSPSCAPAVCNGRSGSCDLLCINDSSCAAGYYCGGGLLGCVPKKRKAKLAAPTAERADAVCVPRITASRVCAATPPVKGLASLVPLRPRAPEPMGFAVP